MRKYSGIDNGYRLASYWDDSDPLAAIPRKVTNAESGDFERLRHFIRIESEPYPELPDHSEHVFKAWVKETCGAHDVKAAKKGSEA